MNESETDFNPDIVKIYQVKREMKGQESIFVRKWLSSKIEFISKMNWRK